jgi:hypothetical protein
MPSSARPSQSLSMPSQTSLPGLLVQGPNPPPDKHPPGVTDWPLRRQAFVPAQFAGDGRPQVMGAMPSSTVPSQSLSQPSQTSGVGVHVPQTPPSSVRPSQSSSCVLQVSFSGQWAGMPHLVAPSSTPALQLLSALSQGSPGL